ncbi:4-hydroxythreonine-4-phosphate dehydrogenase PdxA [Desulfohalovibrio reitneri]|uniref:4-hydroxythreonine-4-phosphate dehydrogenase PdxA n=1 Tax=Desulfohalovibrio reitneri TaxID=1307759 RepID=UPI0004A6F817|nr:4-hydroxythreonine-4-phosphate dehydrogenase PdxA [Desulfohalovibrio reitneri]
MTRPLLITQGDPAGLGPELICRVVPGVDAPVCLIGPPKSLRRMAEELGIPSFWREVDSPEEIDEGVGLLVPQGCADLDPTPGRATREGGLAAGLALEEAARLMLAGRGRALVTCPLHKAMLQAAGFPFPGHTEFLARAAGLEPEDVCMMLAGPRLRVGLVTTHPPLRDVPSLVTRERVLRCLRLLAEAVRGLGAEGPIAVCGLNPHAGEGGAIGREDLEVVAPAVESAVAEGIDAQGPFPADTIFRRALDGEFAAVLAMYHDQGLGPLKLVHFGEAVNATLGLPFVRTSPDHGTGFDLVGTGNADTGGLRAAVDAALRMCDRNTRLS